MMANEKRLIDGGKIESVFRNLAESWRGSFSGVAYQDALERIRKEPSVDAVEVVRCKACKYCKTAFNENLCCARSGASFPYVRDNDFCSYGERRAEE